MMRCYTLSIDGQQIVTTNAHVKHRLGNVTLVTIKSASSYDDIHYCYAKE